MKWYCYKTTNNVNGRYYIGKHASDNIEKDNYLGSGINIVRAVRKYGKENFTREILKEFLSEDEAFLYEKELLTEEVLADPLCYNISPGGKGGVGGIPKSKETREKLRQVNLGKIIPREVVDKMRETKFRNGTNKHSEETKKKLAEFNRAKAKDPKYLENLSRSLRGRPGRSPSLETREKISKANRGKKRSEETRKRLSEVNKGKHLTEETKRKIQETRKLNGPYFRSEEWKKEASARVRKHHASPEYRAQVRAQHLGRVRICRQGAIKEIDPVELKSYLEQGWVKGTGKSQFKGKVWVHSSTTGEKICILPEELQEYLNRGYIRGTGPQPNGNGHLGMKIPRKPKNNKV